MEVGAMIKKYLKEKGISQAHVSRETGIETSKLSLALNGGRKLSLDEYSIICGILGLDTNFFLKPRISSKEEVS